MSSASSSQDVDEANVTTGWQGTLDRLYREYIGEPSRQRDVYVGFGLFFAGLTLGAVGFVVFLYSGVQPAESTQFWRLRKIALVAGLTGLPTFVLSTVVLLPVDRRALGASVVGTALCLVAVGVLVSVYPYEWTTSETIDGSVQTIVTYAAGLVVLSASTGAALVAEYLNRETESAAGAATEADDQADGETVSDEQVEADIDEAMSGTELSWGGVEKQENTKRLSLNMPEVDADGETRLSEATATTTRSEGDDVDSAVDGLRKLQGGEQDTARAPSTEDQVDALTKFREQQSEERVETGVDDDQGLVTRLRSWLFG